MYVPAGTIINTVPAAVTTMSRSANVVGLGLWEVGGVELVVFNDVVVIRELA